MRKLILAAASVAALALVGPATAQSPIVIGRESRRPSIPETLMIETKSRSVLDTPLSRGMTGIGLSVLQRRTPH